MKYKQIIPYIILSTLFIIGFSALTAGGLGKEAYSQETSIGNFPLPRSLAVISEDDEAVCGLKEVVCPFEAEEKAPSFQAIAKKLCNEKSLGDYCWKDLMAICRVEGCRADAIGDQSRSYGFFQIQIRLHNIDETCAQDFACSASWTLAHLERQGYPTYRTYAIQKHNGGGKQAQLYAQKVKIISESL